MKNLRNKVENLRIIENEVIFSDDTGNFLLLIPAAALVVPETGLRVD